MSLPTDIEHLHLPATVEASLRRVGFSSVGRVVAASDLAYAGVPPKFRQLIRGGCLEFAERTCSAGSCHPLQGTSIVELRPNLHHHHHQIDSMRRHDKEDGNATGCGPRLCRCYPSSVILWSPSQKS
eukprot:GHVS01084833.1.p1 GENE.GHVS01084833.1~~GHVS01084833.1.p1  ORF type:complete len:127 (+),score=24.56 GHVS01084833.1:166-546(+)